MVVALIAIAFAQGDAEAAKVQRRQVADKLRPKVAKRAAMMDSVEADVLADMSSPAAHRGRRHLSQRERHHPPGRRDPAGAERRMAVRRARGKRRRVMLAYSPT